jgi:plastocyanin
MRRTGLALAAAALAVLVVAVAAYPASSERAAPARVTVNMTEFKFALSKRTVRKGAVTFRVVNRGTISHDFRIAGKKTRILRAGTSAPLTVTFRRAGRYPYICTLPSHATAGMRGVFIVR